MSNQPLVSVGIPTYNRSESLKRSLTSVINQTYTNLEIIISDNASTDETQQVCEEFCQLDPRVKYIRQPENFGAGNNFRFVLEKAIGEYFMWLGDDDWIDANYIAVCIDYLLTNKDYSLVCGLAHYYKDFIFTHSDIDLNLELNNSFYRVIDYYKTVAENGHFYGLMRTRDVINISMPLVIGSDWHMVASLCFLGKVKTSQTTFLHRSSTWSKDYFQKLCKSLGLSDFHSNYPRVFIALSALRYILDTSNNYVYGRVNILFRFFFGFSIFLVIIYRYYYPPFINKLVKALKFIFPEPIYFFLKRRLSKVSKANQSTDIDSQ